MLEVGLSLGSNLGDRLAFLCSARTSLANLPTTRLVASARVYETEPVGVPEPFKTFRFLNTCLIMETGMEPEPLSLAIHRIEAEAGRVRTGKPNSPRPLDIDLLYAAARTIRTPTLTLPHPRWAERRFVVQPLADVRPNLILPGTPDTVAAVLLSLPTEPNVVLFQSTW